MTTKRTTTKTTKAVRAKKAPAKRTRKSKTTVKAAKPAPRRAAKPRERDPRLPAVGATLTRSFRGRELTVKVLDNGFEFEGQTYSSLSSLARSITKYMINGFAFFGLTDRPTRKATGAK